MSWELMVAYGLMVVLGAGLMHWISSTQLGTKSGLAFYRRYLPDNARKNWSDAQLRDELKEIHKTLPAWFLDALTVVTLVAAVLIAQQVTMGEAGASGSLKYVMILILVALPLSFIVHKLRSTMYARALRQRIAQNTPVVAKIPKAKTKSGKRK